MIMICGEEYEGRGRNQRAHRMFCWVRVLHVEFEITEACSSWFAVSVETTISGCLLHPCYYHK